MFPTVISEIVFQIAHSIFILCINVIEIIVNLHLIVFVVVISTGLSIPRKALPVLNTPNIHTGPHKKSPAVHYVHYYKQLENTITSQVYM